MLDQTTKRKLDSARQILVGKVPDPKAQVEQITTALVYKFMDDMDKESEELGGKAKFFANGFSQYSWTKLLDSKLSGQERLDLYVQAITNMSKNPHIPQLFRDIFKGAFLPYNDARTLSLFLKEINEFNYEHSENLGNAFEYLLSILGSQGDAGQFRTPRHIIDFIIEVVDPKKNETILDPACGTAGFLISAYKHILKQNKEKALTPDEKLKLMNNLAGYDISPDMVKLALVNMYLHGFPEPKIHEYDSLTSEKRWEETFDVILANPPFMTPKGGITPHKRFSVNSTRAEFLFVDYILDHLNIGGRAGIIVPDGVLFKADNAAKQLRKKLLENNLYAIVSLPAGVFQPYSATIKTSILIIDKEKAKRQDSILFAKVDSDGFSLGANRKQVSKNDLPKILSEIKSISKDGILTKMVSKAKKEIISHDPNIDLILKKYIQESLVESKKYPSVKLQDIAEFQNGHAFYKDGYSENGKLVIDLFNISENGELQFSEKDKYVSEEFYKKYEKFQLNKDDLIIVMTDMSKEMKILGRTAIIDESNRYILNQRIGRLKINTKLALVEYVHSFTNSYNFLQQLYNVAKGSAQKYVNTGEIKNAIIPLPSIEIQKKIVDKIDNEKKIIAEMKAKIEKSEKNIKEIIFEIL